jgi:hypothetical protein
VWREAPKHPPGTAQRTVHQIPPVPQVPPINEAVQEYYPPNLSSTCPLTFHHKRYCCPPLQMLYIHSFIHTDRQTDKLLRRHYCIASQGFPFEFQTCILSSSTLAMAVPTFFIQRADPTDTCSALEFFPPKGSDELHEALRQSYPHMKNLQQRMRQAVIEFHLAEQQQQDEFDQFTTPIISNHTTPDYLPSPISSFASTISTPLQASYQNQPTSSASGASQVPSQEQLMTVWSLPSTKAKIHKRRNMTDSEKLAYKQKRIEGACADCKRRRRRCCHNSDSNSPISASPYPSSQRRAARQPKRGSKSAVAAVTPNQPQIPISAISSSFHLAEAPLMSSLETDSLDLHEFDAQAPFSFDVDFPDPMLNISQSPLNYSYNYNFDQSPSAAFNFSADFELFPDLPPDADLLDSWGQPRSNTSMNDLQKTASQETLDWYTQSPHQPGWQTREHQTAVMGSAEPSPHLLQACDDLKWGSIHQNSGLGLARSSDSGIVQQTPSESREDLNVRTSRSRAQSGSGANETARRRRKTLTDSLPGMAPPLNSAHFGQISSPPSLQESLNSSAATQHSSRSGPSASMASQTVAAIIPSEVSAMIQSPSRSKALDQNAFVGADSSYSSPTVPSSLRSAAHLEPATVYLKPFSQAFGSGTSFSDSSTNSLNQSSSSYRPESSRRFISTCVPSTTPSFSVSPPRQANMACQLYYATIIQQQESSRADEPSRLSGSQFSGLHASRFRTVSKICPAGPSVVGSTDSTRSKVEQILHVSASLAWRVFVFLLCSFALSRWGFGTAATQVAQVGLIYSLSSSAQLGTAQTPLGLGF